MPPSFCGLRRSLIFLENVFFDRNCSVLYKYNWGSHDLSISEIKTCPEDETYTILIENESNGQTKLSQSVPFCENW